MKVAVIMGSKSDFDVMKEATECLQNFGIEVDTLIVSAHRTPEYMYTFAKSAKDNGYSIIIAGAGGSAHLPGMVAALTPLPIIGVPIKSRNLKGLDSLLSIVQMPSGVPVATTAINGSKNAALLAVSILSIYDKDLARKYDEFRLNQTNGVLNE